MRIESANDEVVLTCKITGDDITSGYWERLSDSPLPNKTNVSSLSDDTVQLTITRARPNHSGFYLCKIYSQWGEAQSNIISVNITGKRNNFL